MLYKLYETEFGIYNHLSHNRDKPLASVALHDSEDYCTESLVDDSMRTYIHRSIKEFFGLSYLEFIDLPRDIIETMLTVVDEEKAKKYHDMTELEEDIKNK